MGLSVGKDKTAPGKFAYELWNGTETVEVAGGFDTMPEAERAGMAANRAMLMPMVQVSFGGPTLDEILMSDDELLAELRS